MKTISSNYLALYGQNFSNAYSAIGRKYTNNLVDIRGIPSITAKNSTVVSISDAAYSAASGASSVNMTTADIVSKIADLSKQIKAGTLKTINVIPDTQTSGDPVLSLTTKEFSSGADVWKLLNGNFFISITDSKVADATSLASAVDKILASAKSSHSQAQINIIDTAATIVSNIAVLEKLAIKNEIASITIKDGKALSLKAIDITKNADVFNVAFLGANQVSVEATEVSAAGISSLESGIEDNSKLILTKLTIADKAVNLQAAMSNLEAAVLAGNTSASTSPKISQIIVSDKGTINLNASLLQSLQDAFLLLKGPYTLKILDISVSDALKFKAPTKDAILSFAIKDTAAGISAGWDGLQKLAAAKSIASVTVSDGNALSITEKQLNADKDALKVIAGTYQIAVTDVLAADVKSVLKTKNLLSIAITDSVANILSQIKNISPALAANKISGVTITDKKAPTLTIADAYTLTKILPNVTLPANMKLNIADTASMIIAHKRFDLGDIIYNAGAINITDSPPPNLSLVDAETLKSITQISSKTKYNITDSANAIVAQSKITGETILSGAAFVQSMKIFSISDYKSAIALKKWDKTTAYSISDTVDNIMALATIKSDKILKGAKTVRVVDSSANILAKLDQLQTISKTGQIATIASNDVSIDLADIPSAQKSKDPEAIGKIISVVTKSFANGDFKNSGTPVITGTHVKITGWEIVKEQVMLGQNGVKGTTQIDGFDAPIDSTPFATSSHGTSLGDDTPPARARYDYDTTQNNMHLFSDNMTTINSGDIVHGPYVISDKPVYIKAGSKVSFDWDAKGGADAFDVYAYLLNTNTGATIELLNQTGTGTAESGWQTVTKTINSSDDYKFVFVSGTFDETFGKAAGASLYINNVTVTS